MAPATLSMTINTVLVTLHVAQTQYRQKYLRKEEFILADNWRTSPSWWRSHGGRRLRKLVTLRPMLGSREK